MTLYQGMDSILSYNDLKRIKFQMYRLLIIALILTSIPAVSKATTILPMNIEQIVSIAPNAFVCTIEEISIDEFGNLKGETITATVTKEVYGDYSKGETVEWTQYMPSSETRIPSMPEYEAGGTYLIFLTDPVTGSAFSAPAGLDQGSFVIIEDKTTGSVAAKNSNKNRYLYSNVDMSEWESSAKYRSATPKTELDQIIALAQAIEEKKDLAKARGQIWTPAKASLTPDKPLAVIEADASLKKNDEEAK